MSIKNCPNCNDQDIEITYNPQLRRFTLSCYKCNSYFKITPEQANLKCPECKSKNIEYLPLETVCQDCGLVLSSVPPIYVGYCRVVMPWGLKL